MKLHKDFGKIKMEEDMKNRHDDMIDSLRYRFLVEPTVTYSDDKMHPMSALAIMAGLAALVALTFFSGEIYGLLVDAKVLLN